MRRRLASVVVLPVVAVALAGCGGGGEDATPVTVVQARNEPATTVPTTTVPPSSSDVRTVDGDPGAFGGVTFAVASIETSDQDPADREVGRDVAGAGTWTYVHVHVTNPNDAAAVHFVEEDFFRLSGPDDAVVEPVEILTDVTPRSIVRPGADGVYQLAFPDLVVDDPAAWRLRVGALDQRPLELPLDGARAEPEVVPATFDLTGSGLVSGNYVCGLSYLDAGPVAGRLDVDIVADQAFTGGLRRRADLGHRFLEIEVRFRADEVREVTEPYDDTGCATLVDETLARLVVDGFEVEQRYVVGDDVLRLEQGETGTLTFGWPVPDDAGSVALVVGNPSYVQAIVDIPLPG